MYLAMIIDLPSGHKIQIDDCDLPLFNSYDWYAQRAKENIFYLARKEKTTGKVFLFHREVLVPNSSEVIDHRNHDTLDNRRVNIRCCSRQENQRNRKKFRNSTSQYKGVHWEKSRKLWKASITINRKCIKLGRFKNEIDAARVFDFVSTQFYGDFAITNNLL